MRTISLSGGWDLSTEGVPHRKRRLCLKTLLDNDPLPPVEAVMLSTPSTMIYDSAVLQLQVTALECISKSLAVPVTVVLY